jgi:hypothetical protein
MMEIGEVSVRKRRSRQEIKRLVAEFETSGLQRSEFCQKHNLALGALQRGLEKAPDGSRRAKRRYAIGSRGSWIVDWEPALWK